MIIERTRRPADDHPNELDVDTPNDFEAPFPDFAVTLSLTPRDFYIASRIRQIKAAHGSSKTWKEAEWEAEISGGCYRRTSRTCTLARKTSVKIGPWSTCGPSSGGSPSAAA